MGVEYSHVARMQRRTRIALLLLLLMSMVFVATAHASPIMPTCEAYDRTSETRPGEYSWTDIGLQSGGRAELGSVRRDSAQNLVGRVEFLRYAAKDLRIGDWPVGVPSQLLWGAALLGQWNPSSQVAGIGLEPAVGWHSTRSWKRIRSRGDEIEGEDFACDRQTQRFHSSLFLSLHPALLWHDQRLKGGFLVRIGADRRSHRGWTTRLGVRGGWAPQQGLGSEAYGELLVGSIGAQLQVGAFHLSGLSIALGLSLRIH